MLDLPQVLGYSPLDCALQEYWWFETRRLFITLLGSTLVPDCYGQRRAPGLLLFLARRDAPCSCSINNTASKRR